MENVFVIVEIGVTNYCENFAQVQGVTSSLEKAKEFITSFENECREGAKCKFRIFEFKIDTNEFLGFWEKYPDKDELKDVMEDLRKFNLGLDE